MRFYAVFLVVCRLHYQGKSFLFSLHRCSSTVPDPVSHKTHTWRSESQDKLHAFRHSKVQGSVVTHPAVQFIGQARKEIIGHIFFGDISPSLFWNLRNNGGATLVTKISAAWYSVWPNDLGFSLWELLIESRDRRHQCALFVQWFWLSWKCFLHFKYPMKLEYSCTSRYACQFCSQSGEHLAGIQALWFLKQGLKISFSPSSWDLVLLSWFTINQTDTEKLQALIWFFSFFTQSKITISEG